MAHRIAAVTPGSIAERCGIKPGDILLSINGEKIIDQVDYQFLTAGERLAIALEDQDGLGEILIEKGEGEPLGLVFQETFMAQPRTCKNNCAFCFIDQMPKGMRTSLYVKDDDWRLSLMMGNYITMTNLSDMEFDRIIKRRASPLYLSIHAADGEVRKKLMNNRLAGDIMAQLERLKAAGIAFHCQIVLCPGINDGPVLADTLHALSRLMPAARSAALVPVGLTRHREGLAALSPYNRERAQAVLAMAEDFQEKLLRATGTRFVFPADEFYCLADAPIPPDEAYESYPQLENGVGLLRTFWVEYTLALRFFDPADIVPRRVLVATGVSAAPFLRELAAAHPMPGVDITVQAVENRFFGESVTVAGLLTGQDLKAALMGAQADEILLPQSMLRHEEGLFLDGMALEELQQALSLPVHVVPVDGADYLYALSGEQYREATHG